MAIILTGLMAGTLDAAAALLFFLARGNKPPGTLFRYITSAVYGPKAFSGGREMIAIGVMFHFIIAFCWVGLYFAAYPAIAGLKTGVLVDSIIYGLLVWAVMNLIVLPISKAAPRPSSVSSILINLLILIMTIGLPCAYAVRHCL
jgi:uncharacterized membrane protein YagU involved in acid resistance